MLFHQLCEDTEDISAEAIENYVKLSLVLDKSLFLSRYSVKRERIRRSITWVHQTDHHFSLVASSNIRESVLSLLDTTASTVSPTSEFCLPGPVMDGHVVTDKKDVHIAISVGTR